jgi:hypothetical protein
MAKSYITKTYMSIFQRKTMSTHDVHEVLSSLSEMVYVKRPSTHYLNIFISRV